MEVNLDGRTIYDELGVKPIINAAGTFTDLGGSLMSQEVIAAWCEAAQHFVDLRELQQRVGEKLAALLQVEAALVTGGAANGILLGTAAAITLRDADFVRRTFSPDGQEPYEVLRQTAHRDLYDRQLETCGIRIVDVETVADVERSVNERTMMMMAYNLYEPEGKIDHNGWLRLARRYTLPTLLDAAADTPPVENLWHYSQLGYDMVVFSGGKAIRGPQGTGLLLGRRHLIEAARQNAVPNEGTIGRAAKVSKEDIVAVWKAVEQYVRADGNVIWQQCERRAGVIAALLREVPTVTTRIVVPQIANRFPHVLVFWNEQELEITRAELKQRLRDGTPGIATGRVYGTGDEGFLISVVNLQTHEEQIVGERIRAILSKKRGGSPFSRRAGQ